MHYYVVTAGFYGMVLLRHWTVEYCLNSVQGSLGCEFLFDRFECENTDTEYKLALKVYYDLITWIVGPPLAPLKANFLELGGLSPRALPPRHPCSMHMLKLF